ncbi:MAG: hypothetical protein ACRENO_01635 [Thermodesulfobacteriota bacterium]
MNQIIFLFIFVVVCGLFGFKGIFADELDTDYGEYVSPGNVWVEVTYSAAKPQPWNIEWRANNPGENYPRELSGPSGEIEIIKNFFMKFDITILDAIISDKNAQLCEAVGCLAGTYHLLIPAEDIEKFPPPKKQIKIGISVKDIICDEGLELIIKSTDKSPACVKPETTEKLIERGWAYSLYKSMLSR